MPCTHCTAPTADGIYLCDPHEGELFALLGQIPALKSDHFVASADNAVALTMSSPSPLSMPVALEKFLPKIASAVDGMPAQ